ncbi:MAG: hypothetical protein DHS20C01_04170 [marine bacterium B5-7]|nr:MAG: hypothetical protein DHS20C01_04170 [marine bacterium B5-7]
MGRASDSRFLIDGSDINTESSTKTTVDDEDGRYQRAIRYPYDWPSDCYLFHSGRSHLVHDRIAAREGRVAVLAYGSNRSPEQLMRKFGKLHANQAIFVERCELSGWDVIHSAHVTRYGAIPAALVANPDVTIRVAVTWLDNKQLYIMDESESTGCNYGRQTLTRSAKPGDGDANEYEVQAYVTSHGPLRVDQQLVSHAAIDAKGRPDKGLHTIDVLKRAHTLFASTQSFKQFVLGLCDDARYRKEITHLLKQGL